MSKRRHEPDELQNKDEGSGSGFGEAQTIDHLAGREPAKGRDRRLRDIGKDSVSAPKSDYCHQAEETAELRPNTVRSEQRPDQDYRAEPDRQPDRNGARRVPSRWLGMGEFPPLEHQVDRALEVRRVVFAMRRT